MKKTIKIVSLMLSLVLLLAACGGGSGETGNREVPKDLSVENAKAEDAVAAMFEALKVQDHEAVLSAMDPSAAEMMPFDGTSREVYADTLSKKLSYEIMSSDPREGVEDGMTDVIAKVTVPDMSVLFPEVFTAVLESSFSMDIETATDDEIEEVIRQKMEELVAKSNVAMKDFTVAIEVKQAEGKWVVVPSEELINAILGGLEDVTNSMLSGASQSGEAVSEVETNGSDAK